MKPETFLTTLNTASGKASKMLIFGFKSMTFRRLSTGARPNATYNVSGYLEHGKDISNDCLGPTGRGGSTLSTGTIQTPNQQITAQRKKPGNRWLVRLAQ